MTIRSSAATVLVHTEIDASRCRTRPDQPAYHIPAMYDMAFRATGWEPTVTASAQPGRLVAEGWQYQKTLARSGIGAVVQGYATFAAFFVMATGAAPPIIQHTWKVPGTGPRRMTARLADRVLAFTIKRSAFTVLASKAQQRTIAEQYPRARTLWVPVTADTSWYTPGDAATDLLDRHGLRPHEYLACVGDIDRDEALPVELARRLKLPYVRVTRDPRTAERARQAFAAAGAREAYCLERIPFTELRDVYRSARVLLVAPTETYHPAGLTTVTETMACGGMLMFPRNVTAEGYVEHGQSGVLFDDFTIESWMRAAAKATDDASRDRMRQAARDECDRRLNFAAAAELIAARLREAGLVRSSSGDQ
jgi:hypothetical protein